MIRPLEGRRVVEIAASASPLHVRLAISMAGKIASELGADVAVIEPIGGDPTREAPPFMQGPEKRSALFEFLNGGKRIIPERRESDRDAAVANAEAIIVDASIQPPIHVCAVVLSSFGPRRSGLQAPASEFTIMAMTGVLHLIREQVGEPMRLPGHQPSYAAGLAAFMAMSAGLLAPKPIVADVSVMDALLWVNWKIATEQLLKTPTSNQTASEWQAVPAIDGYVALVYMDRDWPALVELVDDDRLRQPCFATRPARLQNLDALTDVLRPWFAVRRKSEIYLEAQRRSIPLGPVWTVSDLLCDAQYLARDFLARTPTGVMPRLPVMWNGQRPRSAISVPEGAIDG